MNQLDLLAEPAARRSDPSTSHDAAAQARELAAQHHRVILACLEAHGALGKDGIATRTHLTGTQVARRTCELNKMGRIQATGKTVLSTAGRKEREWEIAGCYFEAAGERDRLSLESKT